MEEAESRGLIRVVEDHGSIDVRFNHPLFGEVIRRRLGMAAARRLRGEVVRALQDQPLRGPTDRIRLAELTLDSDQTPDVQLLISAARDAIVLTNVTLGERLARAAVNAAAAWSPRAAGPVAAVAGQRRRGRGDAQLVRP